ncbi:MAG: ABC transporter ATP-binding protein [Dehalococcoidia bacterium]|nr:MAG: ABC transporter ATP-binding protein [Dehalococcoidia bacterium]
MLTVEGISVAYGHLTVLREVSLTVNDGEIDTLIGANGAGKSTLLNAISGTVPLKGGSIWLDEKKLSGLASHRTVRLGLGYVPEGRQIFGAMSVMDNLTMGGYALCARNFLSSFTYAGWFLRRPSVQTNLESVYRLFPILKERQNQQAGCLSGGEQQMLAIGRALMSSPRMLLLDEPSLGLAPTLVRDILKLLGKLRDEGLTILLIEQDANAALKIADRGYVMERGRITIEGTAKELLGDDRVRQAYLGKSVA